MVVACYQAVFFVNDGREMPGHKFAMAVAVGLSERKAKWRLSTEVHVSEQELADQICGDGGLLCFGEFVKDLHSAPVEEANAEGAEVVMRRKEGCGLRTECCGSRVRLREGGSVSGVGDDLVEYFQSDSLSAAMLSRGGFEANLFKRGNSEVALGTRNSGVRGLFSISLYVVNVGLWRRLGLLKVEL